jgi:hypothetical protein
MRNSRNASTFLTKFRELTVPIMMNTLRSWIIILIKWTHSLRNLKEGLLEFLRDSLKNKKRESKNYMKKRPLMLKLNSRVKLLKSMKKKRKLRKPNRNLQPLLILKLRRHLHQRVKEKVMKNLTLMFQLYQSQKYCHLFQQWVKTSYMRDQLMISL